MLVGSRAVVTDFGLARLIDSGAGGAATTRVAVGTPDYMAPEQIEGGSPAIASDIYALGAVMFEMVTGRRAFQRETAAETMTAILREDPPEDAIAGVPPAIERIVRRCLEKKPEARFRSAHDLAFALEAFSGTTSASAPNLTTTVSAVRDSPTFRNSRPAMSRPSVEEDFVVDEQAARGPKRARARIHSTAREGFMRRLLKPSS
jgi:serine/threonine protein kinase